MKVEASTNLDVGFFLQERFPCGEWYQLILKYPNLESAQKSLIRHKASGPDVPYRIAKVTTTTITEIVETELNQEKK